VSASITVRRTADGSGRHRVSLLNWGLWTLFGSLQASTWILSPIGGRDPHALRMFAIALFNAYMWAVLTPFIFRLAFRVSRAQKHRARWVVFVLVLGIAVAAVVAILASSVHGGLPWSSARSSAENQFRFWALSRWYFEELVLFFLVFGAGIGTDMFRKYQAREREAARLREQATLLEAERAELNARLADARLAVLRSQLNPHFLFNTLNAVSALVVKDPAGVRDMIALLSELLRSALTEAGEEEIPVEREMELLRLYLEILEIRYQGQLRTAIVVDGEAREALVPRMILQPLVENAMKHGVAPATGEGSIEIRAQRDGYDLVLSVQDSGAEGGTANASDGAGVGLRLTRQRLSELYGDQQKLELVSAADGGTIARISLPYHTSTDLRQSAYGR
jgi:two-component system, LytTR family, sensor kinase